MAPSMPTAPPRTPVAAPRSASAQNLLSAFSPVFDLELLELDGGGPNGSGCGFDRRWSHLSLGGAGGGAAQQRLMALLRADGSMFTCQLWQELHRLQAAYTLPPSAAPPANGAGGPAPDAASAAGEPANCSHHGGGCCCAGGSGGGADGAACGGGGACAATRGGLEAGRTDIEGVARELLAGGYMVQVRDDAGAERPKDVRQCLQQLRHRFIVCTGVRASAAAAGNGGCGAAVTDATGDAHYLPEPLVVEPRFRDQFAIAQPTPAYEALLEAVPPCYVGTVGRLEAVVSFLCDEMAGAFKAQGLAVPPWRTKQATLSKWAPQQLSALAAKIAGVRRPSGGGDACSTGSGGAGAGAAHAHAQLCASERPAANSVVHAAAGSAPAGEARGPVAIAAALANAAEAAAAAHVAASAVGGHISLPDAAVSTGGTPPPLAGFAAPAAAPLYYLPPAAAPGAPAVPPAFAPPPAAAESFVPSLPGAPPPLLPPLVAAAGAGVGPHGSTAGGGTPLKFTRKASAEWKERRGGAGGKKATSLLAAALKKSGSRGSLARDAAAAAAVAARRGGGGAVIRTAPNEAGWGKITTVRWGALHEQPAAAAAAAAALGHPLPPASPQQQPAAQHQRPASAMSQ